MMIDAWQTRVITLKHPFMCPYRRYSLLYNDFVCTQPYSFYFDLPEHKFPICQGTTDGFIDCPLEAVIE